MRAFWQNTRLSQLSQIASATPACRCSCGQWQFQKMQETFLRYLRAGLLVSTSAPSVVTTYTQSIDMRDTLFIVMSQSGRSPGLLTGARSARENGALTVAIANDVTSPATSACELTLPMQAGLKRSVAATKSVVLSMVIGAQLHLRSCFE